MAQTHVVYLGLGANIGDKERSVGQAIERIAELIGVVERRSALYQTRPWGFSSPNSFINACIRCRTGLSPHEVLQATKTIEKEMGRTEKTHNRAYQDRIIDIDILLYDDIRMDTPELTIPHPMMYQREFVMVPLREISDEAQSFQ